MLPRLLHFFGRHNRHLADNSEELAFHIAVETEENIARGMSATAAQHAARKKLGNTTLIREEVHRMNTIVWLEQLGNDLRHALRFMRRNRAFTTAAILTLALGIGGNTAIFSVIRAVLLKPLGYREPDRLVYLAIENPKKNVLDGRLDPDRLQHLQKAKSLAAIGAFGGNLESVTLSGRGRPEALKGARVSANFLSILGVRPIAGRSFLPNEDVDNGPPAVMISHELWTRRFGHDSSVVGQLANIDGKGYTIVGVLPRQFEFPFPDLDVWFTRPSHWSALPSHYWRLALIQGFGRLQPSASLVGARAELQALDENYAQQMHAVDSGRIHLTLLRDRLVQNVRSILAILLGAVAVVLFIACVNVASLLLSRSVARSREFAIRTSIGASRKDLIRQLLVESVVLALTGGLLGVALALATLQILPNAESLNLYTPGALTLPGASHIRIDGPVLAFTVAVSFFSGILFGLVPALQLARPNVANELRQTRATISARTRSVGRLWKLDTRNCMVAAQIAFSLVLLIGAALLMRSVIKLQATDPGFDPENLLTSKIALSPAKYPTDEMKAAFYRNLVDRIAGTAGITNAMVSMSLPTTVWIRTNITRIEGRPAPPENNPLLAVLQSVTPDYFRTLRIPIRRGRDFGPQDNAQNATPVTVINERLAEELWPDYKIGFNPVGLHISEGYDKALGLLRVIGIAANVQEGGLGAPATAEFYVPSGMHPPQNAYLVVRTKTEPLRLANTIRSQVEAVDHDQSISEVRTMNAVLQNTLGQRKTILLLLNSFSLTALLLTTIGVYGTIAYSISHRTQELGIRRALGAQSVQILRLILKQGLVMSLGGITIGLLAAAALTSVMKSLLFEVSATDPLVFLAVSTAVLLVALLASYLPARRATKIDPMQALRAD